MYGHPMSMDHVMNSDMMASDSNRTNSLCFSDYDAFGFDLDHTLARYNLTNLFDLTHKSLVTYLVKEKGYDESLLDPFEFDKDFLCKGLILDSKKGNFLKLTEDGTIIRASHGSKFLTNEEIQKIYGKDQHWKSFEKLIHKVDNVSDEFRIFENFFDMCGVVVSARIIDLIDKQADQKVETYDFFKDVMCSLNETYHQDHYREEKGSYFPVIKTEMEKYVYRCSEPVKKWLTMLRQNKKRVFLMTSSYVDYATQLLEHILGNNWQDYFDFTLTFAKKPSFFHAGRDFLSIDGFEEKEAVKELELGKVYSQGNFQTLHSFLAKITGKENPQVLYFGDSLRSDVFPSKHYANWETVYILEEMALESMSENDKEPDTKKPKLQVESPSQLEKEYVLSSSWGSFFTDDHITSKNGDKQMNTLWGYITRKFADLAIPTLDHIADFSIEHEYEVFDHTDPKQWGFYPCTPASLKPSLES